MTKEIFFKIKFTSKDLQNVLGEYWISSFKADVIIFNLEELEWISNEELAVWYGWMYQLIAKKKYIRIKLPNGRNVSSLNPKFERRKRALSNLVYKASLYARFSQKYFDDKGNSLVDVQEMGISPSMDYLPKYEDNLIPFYKITAHNRQSQNANDIFEIEFTNIFNEFPIEKAISQNLRLERLTQLDNYSLSYIIPKELYTNSCFHAYNNPKNNQIEECYISLGYEKKVTVAKSSNSILKSRELEKIQEERAFYRNYKNSSFLNFTFFDFGVGIPETLRDKYIDSTQTNGGRGLKDFFAAGHSKANLDSRILEYALLLFTSRNELKENLAYHDFIPRGLYVIKDIVKRNKGLITVRSNKGRITFDYSESQTDLDKIVHYKAENDEYEFPGTLINVVLPSAERYSDEKSATRKVTLQTSGHKFTTVSLLNLYLKAKTSVTTNIEQEQGIEITKYIFSEISSTLHQLHKEGSANNILFDYSGIDVKKHDFSRVLFYYLVLTPLIDHQNQAFIINLINSRIIQSYADLINSLKQERAQNPASPNLKTEEIKFLQKPIPCVLANGEIQFIGLESLDFQERLKTFWETGTPSFVGNQITELNNFHFSSHGTLQSNSVPVIVTLPELKSLREEIAKSNAGYIRAELNNHGISFDDLIYTDEQREIHNYNDVLLEDSDGRWYFTTNGKYQDKFISFIEKLYKKQYRQWIATFLVYAFSADNSKDLKKNNITKILTVTLSSQLLGKEVKEIYDEIFWKDYLQNNKSSITLIPLSNYYDFEQEEPFKEINSKDNVLVVNDVISTGNLSYKILNSISNTKKGATVAGLLTVVDARNGNTTYPEINERIVSLALEPTTLAHWLPSSATGVIWISPLVNAPITMKRKNSVNLNILFPVDEFLNEIEEDNLVTIGHIKHNTLHHTYYLRTSELYKSDRRKNYNLFKKLFVRLEENKSKKDAIKIQDKASMVSKDLGQINKEINKISEVLRGEIISNGASSQRQELLKDLSFISERIKQADTRLKKVADNFFNNAFTPTIKFDLPKFDIDYVFIPFLSTLMNIMDDLPGIYQAVNQNKILEVYPIPRIMTPKGWRFTFPPKFLNNITKDSKVFIMDDGSWTGETLIQMIDSICFLAVSEIIVLSIVARFDDYQREFLSRIQRIKSKHDEIQINIFFGTHLHIPIYSSDSDNCPFIAEEKELRKIAKINRQQSIDDYIQLRLNQIKYIDNTINPEINNPTNIPTEVNKTQILLLRNFIGKYEGFRLYEDDVLEITQYEGDLFGDIDVIMAIILHEPYLLQIIKRLDLQRDAINRLQNYLNDVINGEVDSCWDKVSIVRLCFLLDNDNFTNWRMLSAICNYCNNEKNAINYLSYALFRSTQQEEDISTPGFRRNVVEAIKKTFDGIKQSEGRSQSSDVIERMKSNEYEAFRQLLNQVNVVPIDGDSDLVISSLRLMGDYKQERTEGIGHESLSKDLRELITKIFRTFSRLEDDEDSEEHPAEFWTRVVKPRLQQILKEASVLKDHGVFIEEQSLMKIQNLLFAEKVKASEERDAEGARSLISSIDFVDDMINGTITNATAVLMREELTFIIEKCVSPKSFPGKFFYEFNASFVKTWREAFLAAYDKFTEKNFKHNLKVELNGLRDAVTIHKFVLDKVFATFLQNFYDHVEAEKTINFYIFHEDGFCYLKADQDQNFDITRPGGLGIRRITKMLLPYSGEFIYPTEPAKSTKETATTLIIKIPLLSS